MNKIAVYTLIICLSLILKGFSQEEVVYKVLKNDSLTFAVYQSKVYGPSPAMIFYFGGGWNGGGIGQFEKHAQYFSARGITCFLVNYRTKSTHGTTPFESLKDAKSAFRFIKENAITFNINPQKMIAGGGSAGGHLAAALASVDTYNDSSDNLEVSTKPAALVLFNPVIDNGPAGYGYERIDEAYKSFSPLHNLKHGHPPTIFFLGNNDALIPTATAKYYKTSIERLGSKCELYIYENAKHGFFNYRNFDFYKSTVRRADDFLKSLGFLSSLPKVKIN